jgi:hypothetical protein
MSAEVNKKQEGSNNHEHASPPPTDNTFAMFVVAGMVASAAGFSAYTRHAGPLLRQMNKVSEMQGIRTKAGSSVSAITKKAASKKSTEAAQQAKQDKDDIF